MSDTSYSAKNSQRAHQALGERSSLAALEELSARYLTELWLRELSIDEHEVVRALVSPCELLEMVRKDRPDTVAVHSVLPLDRDYAGHFEVLLGGHQHFRAVSQMTPAVRMELVLDRLTELGYDCEPLRVLMQNPAVTLLSNYQIHLMSALH